MERAELGRTSFGCGEFWDVEVGHGDGQSFFGMALRRMGTVLMCVMRNWSGWDFFEESSKELGEKVFLGVVWDRVNKCVWWRVGSWDWGTRVRTDLEEAGVLGF